MTVRAKWALLALAGPMLALLAGGCPQSALPGDKESELTYAPFRVEAITPNAGPAAGGTRVTIRGGPFNDKVGVLFGAHAAVDPIIVNQRMITAFAPPQAPGVVDVMVLANGGQVTVLGAYTYEEPPPPPQVDVISIFPAEGRDSGGTEVTITGENFAAGAIVKFGELVAEGVVVLSPQLIVATTPAAAPGIVDVHVKAGQTEDVLEDAFEYFAVVPRVDSVEPASGPVAGGTPVTLRGANLPADAGVLFGDVSAAEVTVVNEQLITAVSPPGASAGVVDVTLVYNGSQLVAPDAFEYVPVDGPTFDDGTDTDGDGATDYTEEGGWEIWIDSFGQAANGDTYFNVYKYTVSSDPNDDDTDDDGLTDDVEFLIRTDPRKVDSDGDSLHDSEEWNQWLTTPTSVDTDGDSRGDPEHHLAPNQALFDGLEMYSQDVLRLPPGPLRVLKPRATSPTLSDTDGDGFSDAAEFDSTVRNGALADLPRLEYELVDDVDVRLNVQYAESIGQSNEYGVRLTESESETIASSFSNTLGWSVEVGVEFGYADAGPHVLGHVNVGVHGEKTWTSSKESSQSSSREVSRLQSDSREFTETAADGSIRTAILLRNPGNTTFTLSGLGVLLSQREKQKPDGDTSSEMQRKTIATMKPVFDTFTLAPGETAGPFELAATGVNAQVIKELLAAPDTLMLGTAAMNFTDSSGLDFDFVRQFTAAQTAYIVIDFGDGEVRHYNVATNVDRNSDSTYRGIKLRRVFEEVLGLPFGNAENGYTAMANPDPANDLQVLQSLLGRRYAVHPEGGRDVWTIVTNNPAHFGTNLNDTVLRAGDYLHLMFSRDDDNDGLSNTLEKAAGTDVDPVLPADADGDGLTDYFEVTTGWVVFENPANPGALHPDGFEKRRMLSDPRSADADEDGFTDAQEFAARSDPSDPDTDGDSLLDGQDPFPIRRAGIRFVDPDAEGPAHDGLTWRTAFQNLNSALVAASTGFATPAVPDDDVAQIWVANGEYKPTSQTTAFLLQNRLGIYGGFSGSDQEFEGEAKRGQRLADARVNGCVINGDLSGNDVGAPNARDGRDSSPPTRTDNARGLVRAPVGTDSSARFDGFLLTGSAAVSAMQVEGSPIIENCAFVNNAAAAGGAMSVHGNGKPEIRNCTFGSNVASAGGAAHVSGSAQPRFEFCSFEQNEAQKTSEPDDTLAVNGGALVLNGLVGARVHLVDCDFVGNQAWNWGGGVFADSPLGSSAYVRADTCRFFNNIITRGSQAGDYRGSGGGMFLRADAAVFNSVFWGNSSENHGGGIQTFRRLAVNNCTFAANRCMDQNDGGGITAGDHFDPRMTANVTVENTILWNNWHGRGDVPDDYNYDEVHQLSRRDGATMVVRNSCFNEPGTFAGGNNIGSDPELIGLEIGDLRIGADSPCVDRGNAFVDVEPLTSGLQRLPLFDFFGVPRILDGNGDGFVAVDIGACEAPPQQ